MLAEQGPPALRELGCTGIQVRVMAGLAPDPALSGRGGGGPNDGGPRQNAGTSPPAQEGEQRPGGRSP